MGTQQKSSSLKVIYQRVYWDFPAVTIVVSVYLYPPTILYGDQKHVPISI